MQAKFLVEIPLLTPDLPVELHRYNKDWKYGQSFGLCILLNVFSPDSLLLCARNLMYLLWAECQQRI